MEPLPPSKEAGARDVSDDDSASSAERQRAAAAVAFTFRASSASYLLPTLPAPELQQRLAPPPPPSHDAFLASVRRTPRIAPSEPKLHSVWGGDEPDLNGTTTASSPAASSANRTTAGRGACPARARSGHPKETSSYLVAHDNLLVHPRLAALLAKLEAHLASNPASAASAASAAFLLAHDEVLARKVRVAAPTRGREPKLTCCL